MSRSREPKFRGHIPRSAKLKAIATALFGCAFVLGSGLGIVGALETGSIQLRRNGTVHQWIDDPITFIIGIVGFTVFLVFWALGAFGALRGIGWRNWRH